MARPAAWWAKRASLQHRRGNRRQAEALYQHAVALTPDDVPLKLAYARVLQELRRYEASNRQAFAALAQDPLLSRLKMIAEPWDIGPGGYQLGGFPGGWLEWNDRYRDTLRAFWIEGAYTRGDFAQRLCASSDIFQPRHRAPAESVNYIVSHDGFTLADLVSHAHKHNHANGEHNRDGHGHNHSGNYGVEQFSLSFLVNCYG